MATFIAGPCVIESMELLDTVAQQLVRINQKLGTNIIFKASFDKANRTSIHSFRGPGLEKGLQMLADIKSKYGLRITTDIHESYQAEAAPRCVLGGEDLSRKEIDRAMAAGSFSIHVQDEDSNVHVSID